MDDSTLAKYTKGDEWAYRADKDNFAQIAYQELHERCYTVPVVTGSKYYFHFGAGNEWTIMEVSVNEKFNKTDKPIYFINKFEEKRHAILVDVNKTI